MAPHPDAWQISHAKGGEPARRGPDRTIATLAAQQHGVVTVKQILACGISYRMIEGRVAAGNLHRIHHGVLAVGHPALTPDGRRMAAVLACGSGAVLSHVAAAAHHGIRETAATRIDVMVPGRAGRSRTGIAVHSGSTLTPGDITELRRVPCTTLVRTIFDLATVLHPEALEHALHRAQLKPGSLDPGELATLLERFPRRSGTARLRWLLGPLIADGSKLKSELERLILRLCRRERIPPPRANAWIPLPVPAGGLEVDFSWPDRRLVVEADGRAFHTTTRSLRNDPARDRAVTLAGWTVVRYTWWDVAGEPARVAAELRALLASAPDRRYLRPPRWRRRSSP